MKQIKYMFLFSIVGIFLILTACSDSDGTSAENEAEKELSFFHRFTDSPNKEYFEGVVERFEEENPDIKINISSAINEDYKQKVNVLMSNQESPDIYFTWAGEYSNKFAESGHALDLTEYDSLIDQVIDSQLGPYTYNDEIIGIPIIMDGKAFFYNMEIFDDLGVEEPENWDEFIDILEKIKSEDIIPIAFGNQDKWAIGHYLTTLNQRIVDEDTLESDYNPKSGEFSDKSYIDALEKVLELEPYFTNMPNAVTDDLAISSFVNGEAAIYYNQFNQYPYIGEADFDIDWFNFPSISGGQGDQAALTGSPQGFMVSSNTEYPDEAAKFLEFLTSPEEAKKMVEDTGMISSSKDIINDDVGGEVLKRFVETIEEASEISIWMDSNMDARVADVYLSGAQEMLNDNMTPEEVMEKVQEEAKKLQD